MYSDAEMRRRLENFAEVWRRVSQDPKVRKGTSEVLMPRKKAVKAGNDHLPGRPCSSNKYNK